MENLKKSFLVRGDNIVGFSDKKNFSTAPLGTVLSFAGQARPNGYLLCDGASYKVTDYPDLYAVIGNTYGGDSTNFNVPNLVDASQSPAPTMIYIIKAFHTNEGVDSDAGSGEENKIDSISVNGSPVSIDENKNVDIIVPDAYDDTALGNRIKAIEDDYVKTADIPTKVSVLTNDSNYQTAEQVNSTVTTEIAKVVADAPESLNTLKEMSDWIAGHEDDASAMNSAISDNKTAITALQTGKADKSEIPTTVAQLTDSADYAKKTDLHSHDNKTVLDGITSTKVSDWGNAYTHSQSAHAPSNAQANVIETIKVNGTALTPSSKAVNITVPTGTAANKGVDTSIVTGSNSTNLPTSKAVSAFVEGMGYSRIVSGIGSYTTNATSCNVSLELDTSSNYSIDIYDSKINTMIKSYSYDSTAKKIVVTFDKVQTTAGTVCVIARKVG